MSGSPRHTHRVGVPESPYSLCRLQGPGETQLLLLSPGSGCFFRKYLNLPLEEDTRPSAAPQTLPFLPQENLMLSILPKHVADEMLKDMKKDESQKDQQQFNTMYMYRHENVRCASRGHGLPEQDGLGPCGIGLSLQARELPWGLEARSPHSVHPTAGAASLMDTVAETCFRLCGSAHLLPRCHPEWGSDICEAAQPFRASSGAQSHAPSRKDARLHPEAGARQYRERVPVEESSQDKLNVRAPNSPWRC